MRRSTWLGSWANGVSVDNTAWPLGLLGRNSWQKPLKEGKVCFGSGFEGTGPPCRVPAAGVWGGCCHCICGQEAKRDDRWCLACFPFLFSLRQQSRGQCCPNSLGSPGLPRWQRSCHVDNQYQLWCDVRRIDTEFETCSLLFTLGELIQAGRMRLATEPDPTNEGKKYCGGNFSYHLACLFV